MTEKKPKARKKTRSGKKLNVHTGKLAVPSVKRGEGGKITALTPEEKRAAITTELPAAGKEVMQPTPKAQPIHTQGTLKRGGQRGQRGFAVRHAVVSSAVEAAMGHLSNMRNTLGTDEFHQHHEVFNAIHANIGKMDPSLHLLLGQAKHEITHPYAKTDVQLAKIHQAIRGRLEEGRIAEQGRMRRSLENS